MAKSTMLLRFLCSIAIAHLCPSQPIHADDVYSVSREWRSLDGTRTVMGKVEHFDGTHVNLLRDDNGKLLAVHREKLADYDNRLLLIPGWYTADKSQFEATKAYVSSIAENGKTVGVSLADAHGREDFKTAPYAGLWAAVAKSHAENNYETAAVLLRQVVERIETQRAVDHNRHCNTLASALNNLAVCEIKAKRPNPAAAQFEKIFNEGLPLNDVILHNTAQFLKLSEIPDSLLSLNTSVRRRFAASLPEGVEVKPGMRNGWYYSLDVDVPDDRIQSYSFKGLVGPSESSTIVWAATGIAVSPNVVLAPIAGDPISQSTEGVQFTVAAPTRSSNGLVSQATFRILKRFDRAMLLERSEDSNDRNLRNPASGNRSLQLQPLSFQLAHDPAAKFALFRHKPVVPWTSAGFDAVPGRPVSGSPNAGSTWAWNLNAGLPGGLVCDYDGNPVGIGAFAVAPDKPVNRGTVLYGKDLEQVLAGIGPGKRPTGNSGTERLLDSQKSCVLVVGWKASREKTEFRLSQNNRNSDDLRIRDTWCITCDGDGWQTCPFKGCNKGQITVSEWRKTSTNPNTGRPVGGYLPVPKTCPACSGAGGFVCRDCDNGRLR